MAAWSEGSSVVRIVPGLRVSFRAWIRGPGPGLGWAGLLMERMYWRLKMHDKGREGGSRLELPASMWW